jgi:TusA-related sulfurtransferase
VLLDRKSGEEARTMAGEATGTVDLQPGPTDDADASRAAANQLARAIAATDYAGMYATLARAVRLRYLVPDGPGQCDGVAEVAAKLLEWFGDADMIRTLSTSAEPIADRTSLRYRLLLREPDGWKEVEQHLYVDVDEDGLIWAIDLLCSGFRPAEDPQPTRPTQRMHRFDAGTMGCADGLAQEFRRRLLVIPIGDALLVETSDPAAKEDLPPLARMMGHTVRSVEPSGDGRLLITVERGR